jgi:hypothetical protein
VDRDPFDATIVPALPRPALPCPAVDAVRDVGPALADAADLRDQLAER